MSNQIGIKTGLIALCAVNVSLGAPSFPTAGTSTFLQQHPDVLALADGERLAALYGATIAEDDNPETTPLQFVQAFFAVEANRDALGIDGLELAFHKEFVGRDDRFRVYAFEQIVDTEDSLSVHGSLVKVLVRRGTSDTITYVGAHVMPLPDSALPEDVLDDEDAVAAVDQWPDYEGMVYSQPERVIFHARDESIHRAWRFVGQDNGRSLLFVVDTADGRILEAVSVRHSLVDVEGVVKGWQTAGNAAFGEHEEVPLPGVRVRLLAEDGQYTCPSDEGTVVDIDYCDTSGGFSLSGAVEGDRVTARLVGEWATVWDCAGADAETCILSATPSASAVVECDDVPSGGSPEVDLTFGEAPSCAGGSNPGAPCSPQADCPNGLCVGGWCLGGVNQGSACDPDADCAGGICETNAVQTAQVKAFLAVQQAHDWFKSLQPSIVEVDVSLPVFVDMTGPYPGAFFASFPNRIELHRGSADIVDNPAIPSVLAHEYGHFLVNLATFQSFVGSAVDEDYADTVAALVYDDPRIGCGLLEVPSGGWTSDDESCIRTMEEDCPGTCRLTGVPCLQHADYAGSCYYGTGSNGPCDPDPQQSCFNATGGRRALAGAFWDLRTRLLYCTGNETPCTVNENCTGPEVCADGKCLVPCQDATDCSTGEMCISGYCRVSCSTTACTGGTVCTDLATEQLFTDFLLLSGIRRGFVEPSILTELLTADDDDGDLSNGTPNCGEIICAFVGEPDEGQDPCQPHPGDASVCPLPEDCEATPKMGHGFACPTLVGVDDSSVVVTWQGPAGNPSSPDDFEVNYQTIPPSVILKTTQVGNDPVDRYLVGRTVNGFPSFLGAVVTDWDGPANNITVEIGTTVDGRCREIHSARILPQGSGKWASLAVETVDPFFGDIVGKLEVDSVDGAGGRISGNVAGRLKSASGYAIGIDAGGSEPTGEGNLTVARGAGLLRFGALPGGRFVQLGQISNASEPFIELTGADDPEEPALAGELRFIAFPNGSLLVNGNGSSTSAILIEFQDVRGFGFPPSEAEAIRITGDMAGRISVSGNLFGRVTVEGTFTGDICAANVRPHLPMPSNINLTFGPGATICGQEVKNRYVSFVPYRGTDEVAYQITRTAPGDPVEAGWVDVPRPVGNGYIASVVPCPVFRVWTEPVIEIGDCEIMPVATYEIRATEDEEVFDDPTVLSTIAQPSPKYWGDTVGSFDGSAWSPPNGVVNTNDFVAALQRFQNLPSAPPLTWVDVQSVSSTDPCLNELVNIADVFILIQAFQGNEYPFEADPTNCPICPNESDACGMEGFGGGGGFFGPESGGVALTVDVCPYQIDAEELVTVQVFVDSVDDLAAFETALLITPAEGATGTLTLESVSVDTQDTDFVFYSQSIVSGANVATGSAGAARTAGTGHNVTGPKYLATYEFRASAGAEGVWEVTVDESAYLLDGDAVLIESSAGNVAFIRVGLECTAATHCADGNPCTDDICDSGECSNPNSSSSTPCDDGLFCTATDLCDGNGACVGNGTPCTQFFPLCCENLDLCKAANENCWGYEEW